VQVSGHPCILTQSTPFTRAKCTLAARGTGFRRLAGWAILDQIGESALAIVVANPAAFGLVRMAEAYAGRPSCRNQPVRGPPRAWARRPHAEAA
jgi:hypothetical protein